METITYIRGDNQPIQFTITDNDGNPINITGMTVFFTVKKRLHQADNLALIAVETSSHTNPTQGLTQISLTANQTDIPSGMYYYDVQVVSGGSIRSVPYGRFIVKQDVTKRIS